MKPQFASDGRCIPNAVATQGVDARVLFLRKTYAHLFGAIVAFAALEWALFNVTPLVENITAPLLNFIAGSGSWLLILGLFMAVGWVAERWARSNTSRGMQYLGLGLYVVAEAILFTPLLFIANSLAAEKLAITGQEIHIIRDAAFLTLGLFGALTATVFFTKKDFSFLRGALMLGGFTAMAIIVLSLLFGFQLSLIFSAAMILLAAGYILYYTSTVLQHYPPTHYVAASLALFSAVALMFFYVLSFLMSWQRN